jgi:hypothetical protein
MTNLLAIADKARVHGFIAYVASDYVRLTVRCQGYDTRRLGNLPLKDTEGTVVVRTELELDQWLGLA